MNIQLISDVHLNFGDLTLPGGDVLVMAGDIMEAGHLRRYDNAGLNKDIADRYRRFIQEELTKYNTVLYVMGNHEHYHNTFSDTIPRIARDLPANTTILDNTSFSIGGITFFGGTLWTDCNGGNPLTDIDMQWKMSDYQTIKHKGFVTPRPHGGSYYTNKFTPAFTRSLHKETLVALDSLYNETREPIVVITHHAPSLASISEKYRGHPMNGAYASNLSDFILDRPRITHWLHGHIHDPVDYMIGSTRILSNPRGYVGFEVNIDDYTTMTVTA